MRAAGRLSARVDADIELNPLERYGRTMNSTRNYRALAALGFLAVVVPLTAGGCGDNDSPPEIITLEGKIEKIERTTDKTGKVTVVYYSDKQKQEIPGTAQVTAETEIMIDGAVAILKDLKEGDRVSGEVRVEKKGGKKVQSIVKIHADRTKAGASGH